jgi:hypothetical protein
MSVQRLARWLLVPMIATSLQAQSRLDTTAAGNEGSLKSSTTAGILGGAGAFVGVPGLGSFYAGNTGHGVRHLAIGLVSGGVAVGGVAACWHMDCSDGAGLLMIGGMVAYAVNAVWSVFVGIADAHAYNRRPELPGGTFSPGLAPGGVTLPLVRLEF